MNFRPPTMKTRVFIALSVVAVIVLVAMGAVGFRGNMAPVHASQLTHFQKLTQGPGNGPEASNELNGPAQEQYDNLAYPNSTIAYNQTIGAFNAFQTDSSHPNVPHSQYWQQVGPTTGIVPGPNTQNGTPTIVSGRVTAIAVSSTCGTTVCRVWVGAAGGGIWTTNNGLAQHPLWHASSDGMASNSIGSITIDPNDPSGRTLYVGTGEINGASDTEAGVGLYKSTDYGAHWTLVQGSVAVAANRGIGAIAIDPTNANHMYIGTDVDRHGLSSVAGGRFTPPGAPQVGLYETHDGGATWTLAFSQPSDTPVPNTATGNDFFRGGVTDVKLDPRDPNTVYLSMFDYGVFRKSSRLDGDSTYHQIFMSGGGGTVAYSSVARTQFALAPLPNGDMRVYVVDVDVDGAGELYRTDHANQAAAGLFNGTSNVGWTSLSSSNPASPGFGSYDFCGGQCWYDMPVASPAGQPDAVWIGGQFKYGEVASNGRAILRSTDAGVHFTDMTGDTQGNGMHPDQHVITFVPNNGNIAFIGSDGGVVRTSGSFANASSSCSSRGLSGTDLANCQSWLSSVPTEILSLNDGLATLQFQSVTINPQHPLNDVIGGTQDNGTWAYNGPADHWFETVGGDGGQSVIDAANPNIRMHTYFGQQIDVNFQGTKTLGWDWTADPLLASGEGASFYIPLIGDPTVSQTMFAGLAHVFRTQDSGGSQAYLDKYCNEFLPLSQFDPNGNCGDWAALGGPTLTGSSFGTDKGTGYVVAITRAPSDSSGNILWAGTRRGRLFISLNAAASSAASVSFTRIDIPLGQPGATPNRFISGIVVDPTNPYHAWVSFSGYNAYTPATPGHLFDVVFNPTTKTATWTDISHDLGDVPITGIQADAQTGDIYASTDFGVFELAHGSSSWTLAAPGLPPVTVYGLTIDSSARVLYAATHGRGIWRLDLGK